MLTFLNSVVIPLLAASAIPLLIHFFNRRKVKTIPFSSLRFLKMLESQRIRHVRLYQILLIVVRTLFILFLVLAFSRPAIKQSFPGGASSARTTAVIILDNSYSMQLSRGAENAFGYAKKQALSVLKTLSPDDQVFIFSSGADSARPKGADLNGQDALRSFTVSFGSGGLCAKIKQAAAIFSAFPNLNKECYLISDFKIPQKACAKITAKQLAPDVKVFLLPAGAAALQQNVGIDSAFAVSPFPEINKSLDIKVKLFNYSAEERAATIVHLFGDNKRLAAQNTEIQPLQSKEVILRFVPEKAGYQRLHIESGDDDLLADNRYYLTLHLAQKIKILALNTKPLPALQSALQILNSKTAAETDFSSVSSSQAKNLAAYDIILLNNPPAMSASLKSRLQSFLDKRKSIILIPGSQADAAWPGGKKVFGALQTARQPGAYFSLDARFLQQSLFSPVFENSRARPALPEIYKYYTLSSAGETIISLANGRPFLQRYGAGGKGGNLFVFASALSPDWTNLPLSGVFLPLLQRLFFAAAQTELQQAPFITGEEVQLFLADISRQRRYLLKPPGKDAFPLLPAQSASGLFFDIKNLSEPGLYELLEDGREKYVFAVNLNSNEMKPPYADFEALFPQAQKLTRENEIQDQILQSRRGRELWYVFLALALLMLLSEMLLIRRIEGRAQV